MSSFLLPKSHIDVLLTSAVRWASPLGGPFIFHSLDRGSVEVTSGNADSVGTMLWHANFANAEWDQGPASAPTYVYEELPGEPDPLTALMAAACYSYQTATDEPEVWLLSDPARFISYLESEAVRRLPGADSVPWPVQDRGVFLPKA